MSGNQPFKDSAAVIAVPVTANTHNSESYCGFGTTQNTWDASFGP